MYDVCSASGATFTWFRAPTKHTQIQGIWHYHCVKNVIWPSLIRSLIYVAYCSSMPISVVKHIDVLKKNKLWVLHSGSIILNVLNKIKVKQLKL